MTARALLLSLAIHAAALALVWWAYREPVSKRDAFDSEWTRIMEAQGK